jgi:hypothetical protein
MPTPKQRNSDFLCSTRSFASGGAEDERVELADEVRKKKDVSNMRRTKLMVAYQLCGCFPEPQAIMYMRCGNRTFGLRYADLI